MSYTINHYNGNLITTIADGTVDSTLDLTLIGKNYAGYGAVQNENFVYLLENFAGDNPPAKPVPGQVWFDSSTGTKKLKYWSGSQWRTTGGSEIAPTSAPPSGLSEGDFWYDETKQQVFVYTAGGYALVGPAYTSATGETTMFSVSVRDNLGQTHPIIQAKAGGQTVFVVSNSDPFTLDNTQNAISGFDKIHPGVTLRDTTFALSGNTGVSTGNAAFWGTAKNAEQLGGVDASGYVTTGTASFVGLVHFEDVGFEVGTELSVYNDSGTIPSIYNQVGDTIQFQNKQSGTKTTAMKIVGSSLLPGADYNDGGSTVPSDLGAVASGITKRWNNIYARYLYGTAQQADALNVGGVYAAASTSASPNTVVARDSSANVSANLFSGVATQARYADLAEKYLADAEYEVGTVVMVGGEKEVTAAQVGFRAIGAVSANPAYMMNSELEGGTYVALKGRVPVKVIGTIIKGQRLVAGLDGTAQAAMGNTADYFAIALESNGNVEVKLVECLVL